MSTRLKAAPLHDRKLPRHRLDRIRRRLRLLREIEAEALADLRAAERDARRSRA